MCVTQNKEIPFGWQGLGAYAQPYKTDFSDKITNRLFPASVYSIGRDHISH